MDAFNLDSITPVGTKRGPFKNQAFQILIDRGVPVASILDVGVLEGTGELMRAFPDKHHVLFEPLSEYADTITRSYASAKIPFTLVTAAVSDTSGDVYLQARRQSGDVVSTSSVVDAPGDDDMRIVPGITLDGYLMSSPVASPYLLKIDVDGNEMRILKGATKTLLNSSIIMIETPRGAIGERIGFIENNGFDLFDIVSQCYYDDSFWQCDAIFVRRDLHRKYFRNLSTKFERARYFEFKERALTKG